MPSSDALLGIIAEDPMKNMPIGTSIPIEPIVFGSADATAIPQGVKNWTFFEGAVLTIVLRKDNADTVEGTAVMIAPGLAVTAAHILDAHIKHLEQGVIDILCAGPASHGLELWWVRKINIGPDSDVAYLSLALASAIGPEWRFRTFALTSRTPKQGETVHVIGFRLPTVTHAADEEFRVHGNLYAAAGEVLNVYFPMRDRVLMPFPTIEIACGSLKGMSGGAVIDRAGYLVGVVSRGWETEDQLGPSYAAWIVGALNRSLEIPWPPGIYIQPIRILEIDSRALRIEARDRLRVINQNSMQIQIWFDRS